MDAQWAAVSASDKAQCDREAQARNSGRQAAPLPASPPGASSPVSQRRAGRPAAAPDPLSTPGRRVASSIVSATHKCRASGQLLVCERAVHVESSVPVGGLTLMIHAGRCLFWLPLNSRFAVGDSPAACLHMRMTWLVQCRGVKRKVSQAQLDAAQRDRDRTGRFMPVAAADGSPSRGPEFRGRVTEAFDGGYLATVR